MTGVIVALEGPRRDELAADLSLEGARIVAAVAPDELVLAARDADPRWEARLSDADVLVLHADRSTLTPAVVALCDRHGVRIVALCTTADDARRAAAFGTTRDLPLSVAAAELLRAVAALPPAATPPDPAATRVVAVWGAAGAPGRTTVAIEVAAELARRGRRVCLIDADAHAPSVALALGLPDEGPGLAGACRQAELGGLDHDELLRVSAPLDVGAARVDVLTGINRPSRWPELSATRLTGVLAACRGWVDDVVVDVASSLEADEEIVSDLVDGPRRNAATRAVLRAADTVVCVAAADPVGIARVLRAHADLRALVGAAIPVRVVANRVRPGALGIDARGQVRRSLDRFAGIDDVWFLPHDPRSVDAALLAARAVAAGSPRSPLVTAVRRFVAEALLPDAGRGAEPAGRRISRRGGRTRRGLGAA